MLTYILLGLVAVVVLLAVAIAMKPATFRIERTTTIAAPPGAVMELIEDFHQWSRWSPWDRMDPTQKVTIAGAPRGKGATYHWIGQKNGEGRMEIVENRPHEHVGLTLDFVKPFESHNRCDFTAVPLGLGTHLTWSMAGTNNLMAKGFDFFMNMDRTLGRDFDRGLADIKRLAEESATSATGPSAQAAPRVRSPA